MAFLLIVIFSACIIFNCANCIEDYCSKHQYENRDGNNYMQFTKEPSVAEYSITGMFKGLHCCAKGYRSIEWYKDGIPYPWHSTVSQLIVYPESANQTVYTRGVVADDAGNYTCLLRNDSVVHAHMIQLKVFDKIPDDPKITYISYSKEVAIGQPVRLFCEAFVGRIDLPDAFNEAVWSKSGRNGSVHEEPRVRQNKISREDDQTFGTYLTIDPVTIDDYGEYICTISKPGKTIRLSTFLYEMPVIEYINPNPVPVKKIVIYCVIIIVVAITLLLLNFQYGLLLRVKVKDYFGTVEEDDTKKIDALILYSSKDSELALGVLLPTLETKYNYKCISRQFPDDINLWYTNLSGSANKSHRVIAVLSPSSLNDSWECPLLLQALKQLYEMDNAFCCIILKSLPEDGNHVKNSQGESLASVVRNVNLIQWEKYKDERFWLALRLHLPPKRNQVSSNNIDMVQTNNSRRLNSSSLESLDIFV